MRVLTFIIGIVICLAIIVAGIVLVAGSKSPGGATLGLGIGGLIDVVYLFARKLPSSVRVQIDTKSITLFYRVTHLDSIDTIVCIVGLVVPIAVFAAIWHG